MAARARKSPKASNSAHPSRKGPTPPAEVIEGSSTVFVGTKQLAFARQGDTTNDQYQVIQDVQDNVLIG